MVTCNENIAEVAAERVTCPYEHFFGLFVSQLILEGAGSVLQWVIFSKDMTRKA